MGQLHVGSCKQIQLPRPGVEQFRKVRYYWNLFKTRKNHQYGTARKNVGNQRPQEVFWPAMGITVYLLP